MYRRKSRAQVVEVESSKWRKQTDPWLLYLDVAHSVAESKAESNGMKCNLVPLHLSNYILILVYHIYIRRIVLVS